MDVVLRCIASITIFLWHHLYTPLDAMLPLLHNLSTVARWREQYGSNFCLLMALLTTFTLYSRKKMEKKNLRISNLDFERDIRGTIAEVFGDHEDLLSKVSLQQRKYGIK